MTDRAPIARLQIAPDALRTPRVRERLAGLLEMKARELRKGESTDLTDCALYPSTGGIVIIGIAGHIGSGKDTAAGYLLRAHGFTRVGFSDVLKDEVARKLRRTLAAYLVERGVGPDMNAAIRDVLWTNRTPVTRALLQEFGTEVRRADDPNYWVDRWEEKVTRLMTGGVVAPDCRFRNEAQRVRDLGGYLLRIERPGHAGDSHASEHGLDGWTDWDAVIQNSGTVADLESMVAAWLTTVMGRVAA